MAAPAQMIEGPRCREFASRVRAIEPQWAEVLAWLAEQVIRFVVLDRNVTQGTCSAVAPTMENDTDGVDVVNGDL